MQLTRTHGGDWRGEPEKEKTNSSNEREKEEKVRAGMSSGEEEKVNQWERVMNGAGEKVAIWLQAEMLMWPETNGVARDRPMARRKLASTATRGLRSQPVRATPEREIRWINELEVGVDDCSVSNLFYYFSGAACAS